MLKVSVDAPEQSVNSSFGTQTQCKGAPCKELFVHASFPSQMKQKGSSKKYSQWRKKLFRINVFRSLRFLCDTPTPTMGRNLKIVLKKSQKNHFTEVLASRKIQNIKVQI